MKKNLALFDLDNTLLAGDTNYLWGEFLINKSLINGSEYREGNKKFFQDYKNGCLNIFEYQKFQLKPLTQYPKALLDELNAEYLQTIIKPMISKSSKELVEKHKTAGDLCLVITATNSFITQPIADAYGIENLIGTEPEMVDGKFTGNVSGCPSFKEGKVTRLNHWLSMRRQTLDAFERSYFYSDSHNDLPLLMLVTNPIAVNADEILAGFATQHGWQQLTIG